MDWKEFFRLKTRKFIIFILLFIVSVPLLGLFIMGADLKTNFLVNIFVFVILWPIFLTIEHFNYPSFEFNTIFSFGIFLQMIYLYLLSCAINHGITKLTKK